MIRGTCVRNVNEAFSALVKEALKPNADVWKVHVARDIETIEIDGPFVTEYTNPTERVLFCPVRDANPFFHFFESLWILDGRDDVEFLSRFNSQMAQFSDDGRTFNAPYGHRLRYAFGIDQILRAIQILREKPDTRQAVLTIWNPQVDLRVQSKDIPCNDMIMLKLRQGKLRMLVPCRSNDAFLGAYGANAVQFSVLQEFIASAIGAEVGSYYQVSDSFHIYTGSPVLKKLAIQGSANEMQYEKEIVKPFPLMTGVHDDRHLRWLESLRMFTVTGTADYSSDPFFRGVAEPMMEAWFRYKATGVPKNKRIESAVDVLQHRCLAQDWRLACVNWLLRRQEAT